VPGTQLAAMTCSTALRKSVKIASVHVLLDRRRRQVRVLTASVDAVSKLEGEWLLRPDSEVTLLHEQGDS
jgi:hypothetical protein